MKKRPDCRVQRSPETVELEAYGVELKLALMASKDPRSSGCASEGQFTEVSALPVLRKLRIIAGKLEELR